MAVCHSLHRADVLPSFPALLVAKTIPSRNYHPAPLADAQRPEVELCSLPVCPDCCPAHRPSRCISSDCRRFLSDSAAPRQLCSLLLSFSLKPSTRRRTSGQALRFVCRASSRLRYLRIDHPLDDAREQVAEFAELRSSLPVDDALPYQPSFPSDPHSMLRAISRPNRCSRPGSCRRVRLRTD